MWEGKRERERERERFKLLCSRQKPLSFFLPRNQKPFFLLLFLWYPRGFKRPPNLFPSSSLWARRIKLENPQSCMGGHINMSSYFIVTVQLVCAIERTRREESCCNARIMPLKRKKSSQILQTLRPGRDEKWIEVVVLNRQKEMPPMQNIWYF